MGVTSMQSQIANNAILPDINNAEDVLSTKPMKFQENAAHQLHEILKHNSRAFLADEPGLGKTYSSTKLIELMAEDYKNTGEKRPFIVLYVAPNRTLADKNGADIISKGTNIKWINDFYKSYSQKCQDPNVVKEVIRVIAADKLDGRGDVSIDKKKIDDAIECYEKSLAAKKMTATTFSVVSHDQCLREALNSVGFGFFAGRGTASLHNCYSEGYRKVTGIGTVAGLNSEIKESGKFAEVETIDRLAYAYKLLSADWINEALQKDGDTPILLITVSQGVLFEVNRSIGKSESAEKAIFNDVLGKQYSNLKRDEFTRKFLNEFPINLVIWDEYHRYSTNLKGNIAFFAEGYEWNPKNNPKNKVELRNLFVSATPFRTNIGNRDVISAFEQKHLYNELNSGDKLDAKEAVEMEKLPSFENDFAPLFCGGYSEALCETEELNKLYSDYMKDQSSDSDYEKTLRRKMVRHERTHLQSQEEIHVRKYEPDSLITAEYSRTFVNTVKQSRLMEKAGYSEGARYWGLSLPWILDFSTKIGKSKMTKDNDTIIDSYFVLLNPNDKKVDDPNLFVYYDCGKIKDSISSLPEQNLAFYEICKECVDDGKSNLLWMPPTVPLYKIDDKSVFSKHQNYSKLLIFAEYRYLQRGVPRLLSDYVYYKCCRRNETDNVDRIVPESFVVNLRWSDDIDELVRYDFLKTDYREQKLEDIIRDAADIEYAGSKVKALASIASPAACAKRLGLNCQEIEAAFNTYLNRPVQKQVLWNWLLENEYAQDKNKWTEGILQYCAEGNLYAVMEEWCFMIKKKDENTKKPKQIQTNPDYITRTIKTVLEYEGSQVHVQTQYTTKNKMDSKGENFHCSFAEQLTNDFSDNRGYSDEDAMKETNMAFSSPMWPMVLVAGKGAQEGVDFHEYCLKIMHLTLPRGAVSYEQRNGRIDRFRSLLVRRRVAEFYCHYGVGEDGCKGMLKRMFARAILDKAINDKDDNDKIYPNWHFDVNSQTKHHFEEMIPVWKYTEDYAFMNGIDEMLRSYRGAMGANGHMELTESIDLSAPEYQPE